MMTERNARMVATVVTALIALIAYLLMSVIYLSVKAKDKPDPPKTEILLVEEEFVEVVPTVSSTTGNEDAASYMEETVIEQSQPTPASGTDIKDAGQKNDPAPVVTAKEPSPVKVKKEPVKDPGPAVDKKKQEEEKVKREATNEVANAFKNANGKHNSQTSDKDKGNSGTKTQNNASQGTTGSGSGSVGGGWIIPKYAPVRSTVTGSVKMTVKIDNTGKVISVTFTGGQPPAATDKSVQAAIEREIRAHKFSRSSYDGAEPATAYVTYTFK